MAKWINKQSPGVSIGGQYYPAVDGVIDVPDNISGLEQYDYVRYSEPKEDDYRGIDNISRSKKLVGSKT